MDDMSNSAVYLVSLFCISVSEGFNDFCTDCSPQSMTIVQPFDAPDFVRTLDNNLMPVFCPQSEFKFTLFECTFDKCNCNTTLEVYRRCFNDTLFCDNMSSCSDNCTFVFMCGAELQYLCPKNTFPTQQSTTTTTTTTTTTATTIRTSLSSSNKNSTTTVPRKHSSITTTTVTHKGIQDSTFSPSKFPTKEGREIEVESSTQSAVIAVLICSALFVIISTGGVYLYKQRRRGRRQLQLQKDQAVVIPLENNFVYKDHKMKCGTQQSCDSGIVCNAEFNQTD